MAKATEGTTYTDTTFPTNFKGISDAGMIRGAYHFAHPGSDAVAQADFFVQTVLSAGGWNASKTMQLVLDLESNDGLGADDVWGWVQAWTARVKVLTGRPPIVYTGYYFWRDSVGASNNLDMPLWIASYSSPDPVGIPTPWASVGWAFWQYNDNGASEPGGGAETIPGIAGTSVDVDYFMNGGAYPSLEALCFS